MEKNSYTIDFDLKNNPSKALRDINSLLVEIQRNTGTMAEGMAQQMVAIQGPVDEARQKWIDMSGSVGAYFAVFSENASAISLLINIGDKLSNLKGITEIGAKAQELYNSIVNVGIKSFKSYKDQIVIAQAAISTTTGATKALNIAIAASPYILAAAAVAALAVGVYKLCTSSSEAEDSQKRLGNVMLGMYTEAAKEQTVLNALFEPLNQAKVGSEEWQKAKDDIMAKYGGYLDKIGIEIDSVETARTAYSKLSESILETARARAMEKATSEAGDAYAASEANALKNIREQLYSGIGQGAGKITAAQAGKAWAQIRAAVRSGTDIPQTAKEILEQTSTTYNDRFGTHTMNPIANYIYRQAADARKAKETYRKEMADVQAILGGGGAGKVLKDESKSSATPKKVVPPVTPSSKPDYAADSLAALEARLNELRTRQKNAPIEEQLTFTSDMVALEDQIADIKERLKHTDFEARYTLKPTEEGTPSDGPIKRSMQSSTGLRRKEGGLKDLKLEAPKLDLEQPLEGMDAWNAAVERAREKNAETIGSMGAMGNAMGALGEVIGGQAGAWLDWAGNLLNAIAQALPQLAALITANTDAAATGAASSVASIPFVGPIMAVAAVASVLAALAGLPKFANGGIAYGPTLGLFGEYAGASNNPEVVAPLNRLRQLIQPVGLGGMSGDVRFRIDGRALTGILERETNLSRRS